MKEIFYTVVRIYWVGETETHFVEHFTTRQDAVVRHYKNLASDLDRAGCVYNASYIIDSNGVVNESKVFDRRPTPEPEPEPEE